jgi:hypothetical protein
VLDRVDDLVYHRARVSELYRLRQVPRRLEAGRLPELKITARLTLLMSLAGPRNFVPARRVPNRREYQQSV